MLQGRPERAAPRRMTSPARRQQALVVSRKLIQAEYHQCCCRVHIACVQVLHGVCTRSYEVSQLQQTDPRGGRISFLAGRSYCMPYGDEHRPTLLAGVLQDSCKLNCKACYTTIQELSSLFGMQLACPKQNPTFMQRW